MIRCGNSVKVCTAPFLLDLDMDIEKIRQEIERLKGICTAQIKANPGQTFPFVMEMTGYDKLLSFLDTLSEEPSKSLEEAAEIIAKNILGRDYLAELDEECAIDALEDAKSFVKAGAEWQKSQMVKGAYVESQIVEDGRIELEGEPLPCLNPIILLPYPQFQPGDKVRIVVLKAEEE